MNSQKGDRNLIKNMNQQLVLQLIQGRGPISRRDITEITGLSGASVSGITNTLINQGLVSEVGEEQNNGRAGRRAVLLKLNPNAGYVIGVKIAVHSITCVLTDLEATVVHSIEESLHPDLNLINPKVAIRAIIEIVEKLLKTANLKSSQNLLGIGVGINGVVDAQNGVCCLSPHFGWRNEPFAEPIAEHFGIPVYLENDARTLTIAEHWFGAGREVDHFAAIAVGYGIGSGFVANGQIYRGAHYSAGEFGHFVLQPNGPVCSCGNRGCLESLASIPAILRDIRTAIANGKPSILADVGPLTLDDVVRAAEMNDALTLTVLETAGRWLGQGIAGYINILDPKLLIIHGEATRLGLSFFSPMKAAIQEYTFDKFDNPIRIITEPGGNEVWARGAACVVLSSLFTSPENQRDAQLQFTYTVNSSM